MRIIFLKLILIGILVLPKSLGTDLKTSKPNNTKSFDKFKVHFLEPNTTLSFKPSNRGFLEKFLNTYCCCGESKTVLRILESIEVQLDIEGDDFTQYEGNTPAEVEEHYSQHRSIFSFNLFSQKRSRLILSPFVQQCIGIETALSYNVTFKRQKIDFYRSIQLFSGIAIFLLAGVFSENSLFYYIIGILLGVFSSVLLLVWLSGKLMPKRTMMYSVVIGGWTVGFYIIRLLWNNIQVIMMTYRRFVCWYVIITGIVSFLFCYRWGPPRNKRSKNIIKWLLQLMSSLLIYYSTYFKEAGCLLILIIATFYYFPKFLHKILNFRTKTSTKLLQQKQNNNNTCKLRDGDQKFQVKKKPFNSGLKKSLTREDIAAELDVSLSEQDLTKQNLYPLPDGSFILSEKPPIIITPRRSPLYHRSTQSFFKDDPDEEDYTPKKHYSHIPLPAYTRRLADASSTSDLLVPGHRRNTHSSSHLHRSNSDQRVQTRPNRMPTSAKKDFGSYPKVKIENVTNDDESKLHN